jgi:hypothetical protein
MLNMSSGDTGSAGKTRRLEEPRLPRVTFFKGRGYLLRSQLDLYKAQVQAFALGVGPPEPKVIDPDPFVPLKQACSELGVGRRTIGRRIQEAEASVSATA